MDAAPPRTGTRSSVRLSELYARRLGRRPRRMLGFNLTPMIDVTFNLLIYFVVSASFFTAEGMLSSHMARWGRAAAAATIPVTPLRVVIDAPPDAPDRVRMRIESSVYAPQDFRELADVLVQLRHSDAGFDEQTPVVIHAADRVAWDHVVDAFNAARRAGYKSISFGGKRGEPAEP